MISEEEAETPVARKPAEIIVFALGGRSVTMGEILEAGRLRGEMKTLWESLAEERASERRAEELALELDQAVLQEMSDQFRYDRDLITAEETERWLDERGLTMDDFNAYFRRRYWAQTLKATGKAGDEEADQLSLLCIDALMSGALDRLAIALAWRIAASVTDAETKGEDSAFLGLAGPAGMEKMEAAYQRCCEQILAPDRLERTLGSLRWPLTRFVLETLELDTLNAAREAMLCVCDDGFSMENVAREGRYPFWRTEALAEQLSEDWQRKLYSLAEGDVLAPVQEGEVFRLCRLLRKTPPDLADAAIRRRVEERVLEAHFTELCSTRVKWILPCQNRAAST